MRVLVISYEYPPVGGGGSDVCHYVAKELAVRGHQVRILTAHCRGLKFEETIDGFSVRRIRSFRKQYGGCSIAEMGAFVVAAAWHGIFACRRFRPDILHIHHAMPDGPLGPWLGLLFRLPYVITAHGGDIPGHIGMLDGFFRRIHFAANLVWNKAGIVVTVAAHLAEMARKHYPHANIGVIPNGVDTDFFAPPAQLRRSDKVKFVYAGRLHRPKSVHIFLQAATILKDAGIPDFEVVVYGSGPERDNLQKQAREAGIESLVKFAGWVDRRSIAEAFRRADVFVLPSTVEGMPIACIQAMACGLPVIGADVPGTNDEVIDGETGLLFPAGDAERLAEAMQKLVGSPDLRTSMGRAGRLRCEQFYSWHVIGNEYEDLFKSLVGETG